MTYEELELLWTTLQTPTLPDIIIGKRVSGLPAEQPVYLAIDSLQRRHLLIQIASLTMPKFQKETRGLEVRTGKFVIGSNPEAVYIDCICTDSIQHSTFSAFVLDLIRSLSPVADTLVNSILDTIDRWHSFWAAKTQSLSREDALGLFGELWFLRQWLGFSNNLVLTYWQATEPARHDFQCPSVSVEVKTAATQSTNAPRHIITSLEQLTDPEQGELYLFSLQVCDDALAVNSLKNLVTAITEDLKGNFQALDEFAKKLKNRNYSSECQFTSRKLRILGERLYHVTSTFPRIIRNSFGPDGIPSAIHRISYELDLAVCDKWLITKHPKNIKNLFQ